MLMICAPPNVRAHLRRRMPFARALRTIFPPRHFIADRIASAKPWRKLNRWAHGNQQIKKLRPDAERSIDVGLGRVELGRLHLTAWIDDISHVDDLPDFVGPLDF